jgi:hypothetical protein
LHFVGNREQGQRSGSWLVDEKGERGERLLARPFVCLLSEASSNAILFCTHTSRWGET